MAVLSSIFLRSSCASRASGSAMRFSARDKSAHRSRNVVAQRMGLGFQRIESIAHRRCGHGHGCRLPPGKSRPDRAGCRLSRRAVQPSPASAPAACTASSSACCASSSSAIRSFSRSSSPRMRVRARAFRAANPAAQIRHLAARQKRGKTAIGGIEQMMAFVEDIAQPPFHRRVSGLVGRQPVAAPPARSPAHDWRPRWGRGGRGGWRAR